MHKTLFIDKDTRPPVKTDGLFWWTACRTWQIYRYDLVTKIKRAHCSTLYLTKSDLTVSAWYYFHNFYINNLFQLVDDSKDLVDRIVQIDQIIYTQTTDPIVEQKINIFPTLAY